MWQHKRAEVQHWLREDVEDCVFLKTGSVFLFNILGKDYITGVG